MQSPNRFRIKNRPACNPASWAGFTLIELIAVIMIIGLVLAVIVPRVSTLGETYLKADLSRLQSLIRYLNEAAETRKVYYMAHFDLDKETIRVKTSKNGKEYFPETELRGLSLSGGLDLEDVVVAQLGKVNTGTVYFVFAPTGTTDPLTIHVRSKGTEVRTLSFNPYSGRVTVAEGYL